MISLKKFLLICSGADVGILQRAECSIDHSQYVGIGAAILSTSLLASFSGGYALYTVFRSTALSVALGIFWGLIIFNLDRYLVSSMRKQRVSPNLSIQERLRLKANELAIALPRLLLAIFISVIVTKPLELKLFENEIAAQLEKNSISEIADIRTQIKREFDIPALAQHVSDLKNEIAQKQSRRDDLYNLMMEEFLGHAQDGKTTGKTGKGTVYKERQAAFNRADQDYERTLATNSRQIEQTNDRISMLTSQEDLRIKNSVATLIQANGLLSRLNAFSQLTADNETIFYVNIFLTFLFIMLETTPILLKLLTGRGPYDEIYDAHKRAVSLTYEDHVDQGVDVPNRNSSDDSAIPPKSKADQPATIRDAIRTHEEVNRDFHWRKDPYRLVGTTLASKYRLDKYAGGGGMGAVYCAAQIHNGNCVALKILKPDIVERNPTYSLLFEREVKAAQRLVHPHIVRVLDSGITDEEIAFMVMEWLDGESLDTVIGNAPALSLKRVANMLAQLCDAVEYAHRNNIIHLDIKPGNIFLLDGKPEDFIKVIDFGMARILSSETGTTVTRFLGTYQYCSPEHFGGKVSYRSDIYSLGATLYHMLTGVIPFSSSYVNAKAHPNLDLPPVPPMCKIRPDLPVALDEVVQKALSKKPNERQESAKQFYTEFSSACLGAT